MDKKELRNLSKNELIKMLFLDRDKYILLFEKENALLKETVVRLEEKIIELERKLKYYENAHTPSSKQQKRNTEKKDEENNKPRFPGKPEGSSGGGIEIPAPDKIEEHKLDVCPISGKKLGKPIAYRTKMVIDFPDKPIQVTEHRIMQYISPVTGEIIEKNVNFPSGIYGKNIQSIVVLLKNLTNSNDKIADLLRELGAPSFSSALVQNITDKFAKNLEHKRNGYLEQLRREKYLHADETGFRKDGKNGYVWGIFSKSISIFHAAMSRARDNINTLIPKYIGVIVTDGYNAYNEFLYRQRCWVHLLRDFKECAKDNKEITVQYLRICKLYEEMKQLNEKIPKETEIAKVKFELFDIVTCLKIIKGGKKLVTLIENGGDEWFTALYFEGVPLQNNHAERELRPIVLLRKTIGCYRNDKGKKWIENVISVLHTWKLQGLNLFQNLRLIAS